jgi:hypothetical protein
MYPYALARGIQRPTFDERFSQTYSLISPYKEVVK